LADRLQRRQAALARQREITTLSPIVKGGALVIPAGLLRRLSEDETGVADLSVDPAMRKKVERLAMEAVMEAERGLGRIPRDVSDQRGIGYDIESKNPETGQLYFVEVKGRAEARNTVTITRTEILCSRNEPDKFRLALVVVGDRGPQPPRYARDLPFGEPDFAETSRSYDLSRLLETAGEPS